MLLMGVDPSLTATGIVLVDVGVGSEELLSWSVCRTRPDTRGRHMYQADQDGTRVDALADELRRMLSIGGPVDVVAVEAPAGAQHAAAAKALGLAYGCVRGVLRAFDRTPIMVQAHHAKAAATGSKAATKKEVVDAMAIRWPRSERWSTCGRIEREAVADALAVACAAMLEPTVQAMIRKGAA